MSESAVAAVFARRATEDQFRTTRKRPRGFIRRRATAVRAALAGGLQVAPAGQRNVR